MSRRDDPAAFLSLAAALPMVLCLLGGAGLTYAQQNPHGSGSRLPAGHPRVGNPADLTLPEVAADAGTGANALVWTAPDGWQAEEPASAMRRAQYRVPGPGGDAACVVYYFGPGQGGDAESNARRWGDQFGQPDGRPSSEALESEWIEVHGIRVLLVETSGIYSGGMAPGGRPGGGARPGQMLLGAIAEGPDANWFFKLTGPEATVEANRAAFRAMIESLERGAPAAQ